MARLYCHEDDNCQVYLVCMFNLNSNFYIIFLNHTVSLLCSYEVIIAKIYFIHNVNEKQKLFRTLPSKTFQVGSASGFWL